MESLDPIINYLVDPNSGLKLLITEFLNAVMQYEAYQQSGTLPYERGPRRKAHRNGTRPRTLKTRVGEITLDKPQFREFPFETKVFEKYSRVEQALLITIAESYIQGVSTRKMEELVKGLVWIAYPHLKSLEYAKFWTRKLKSSSKSRLKPRSVISL